jgi:hypothetical protein
MKKNLFVFRNNNGDRQLLNLTCIEDENLSWKARGIHTYIISHQDVNRSGLCDVSICGSSSLQSGIKELKDSHYLFNVARKDKGKFVEHRYLVFDEPANDDEVNITLNEIGNEWEIY